MSSLDQEEKDLFESFEREEWRSVEPLHVEIKQYRQYAREFLKKDRRVNIRISSKDLVTIQKRALEEGIPYQTLMGSVLHKYAGGRLRETEG